MTIQKVRQKFRIFEQNKNKKMSKIKIKNFGPIKEGYLENNGWIDIKKLPCLLEIRGRVKALLPN